ncbi:uncharacterized protein [Macrobrachium rosenbergii]|uniref:uncharacterized protein n=1 Tax=Macrobrachium rosenbergii TaxID=79674 RepID=UPI0034D47B87
MGLKIVTVFICVCMVSAVSQGHQQTKSSSPPFEEYDHIDYNSLGSYENIVTATVDILPVLSDLFDALTPEAAAIRAGSAFDTPRLKRIVMALIPVTRKVLQATARAEGRTVSKGVLDRLDALEKTLPSTFDFMTNVRGTDFYGVGEDYSYFNKKTPYWNNEGEKVVPPQVDLSFEYNPEKFSGSIVSMPNQKPFFVNHPPKDLFDAARA